MDYTERLRLLAINDERVSRKTSGDALTEPGTLDAKTLALVRLASLVAVRGAVASYGAQADAAVSAGATADEMVDVLVGIMPVVGAPCVITAASKLSLALGFDVDENDDQ